MQDSEITSGVSKFLKAVPDLASDYPKIATYLSNTLFALININAIKVHDIVWVDPPSPDLKEGEEEDLVFVEQYFHVMA